MNPRPEFSGFGIKFYALKLRPRVLGGNNLFFEDRKFRQKVFVYYIDSCFRRNDKRSLN